MQYRHEVKTEISMTDFHVLRQRLRAVMSPDAHAENRVYKIRSLYFDNLYDKALREKLDGINTREKWRIRLYNNDTSMIRLECKTKNGFLGYKKSAILSEDEVRLILKNDVGWMKNSKSPVVLSFYSKIKNEGLRPRTIVDYTREPYVYLPGNVRVTLDYNIRTGLSCTDFLEKDCATVPITPSPIILEVKWDEYLPDVIRDIIQLETRRSSAFSKYASCRMFD